MVKHSCVSHSKLAKKNALKVRGNGGVNKGNSFVKKNKEFENAIRNALRIVHNEGSSSNGKCGFKMRRPKQQRKPKNISEQMSGCSINPKFPKLSSRNGRIESILNSIKRNRERRNAIVHNRRIAEMGKQFGKLSYKK